MLLTRRPEFAQRRRFDPTKISRLSFWLAADRILGLSDGDAVGTWSDLSGNGRDATQATAALKPLYKVNIVNGLPVVRFDGLDDLLKTAAFTLNQPTTTLLLAKVLTIPVGRNAVIVDGTTADTMDIAYLDTTGALVLYAGAQVTTTFSFGTTDFQIITGIFNSDRSKAYINGSDKTNLSDAGLGNAGGITIGAGALPNQYANVDVAEVIAYNVELENRRRRLVERYLAAKYAIVI